MSSPHEDINIEYRPVKGEEPEVSDSKAFDLDLSDLTSATVESSSSLSTAGYHHERNATPDDSGDDVQPAAEGGEAPGAVFGVSESMFVMDPTSRGATVRGTLVDYSQHCASVGLRSSNSHRIMSRRTTHQTLVAPDTTSATRRQQQRRSALENLKQHTRRFSRDKPKGGGVTATLYRPRLVGLAVDPLSASLSTDGVAESTTEFRHRFVRQKSVGSSSAPSSRRGYRSAGAAARKGLPPRALARAFSLDSGRDQPPRIPVRSSSGHDIVSLL